MGGKFHESPASINCAFDVSMACLFFALTCPMGFYENRVLPFVIDLACSMPPIMDLRQQVVPRCQGVVLEVGAGSGINFALYDSKKVSKVYALEPSTGMRHKAQKNLSRSPVPVEWLNLPGEKIPLPDHSVDTVLLTYTLCTIPDYHTALQQMFRVLKPGGQLFFCEHGRAPDAEVVKWQDKLTPTWKKWAGGCHLNRPIADYIKEAGFSITEQKNLYLEKGPRFASYMYYGRALKN
jgi:ubiquinone/menaquinone biosynthesis C-methylase UbiE